MSERQIAAMEALFALSEAIGDELSIKDLMEVIGLALEGGHDAMEIQLAMVQNALRLARDGLQCISAD